MPLKKSRFTEEQIAFTINQLVKGVRTVAKGKNFCFLQNEAY